MGKQTLGGAEILENLKKRPIPIPKPPRTPRGKQTQPAKKPLISGAKLAKVIHLTYIGQSLHFIADETGLSLSTIHRIRKGIPEEILKQHEIIEQNEIGKLIMEGLKANLEATQRIVEVTKDEVWLKAQRAPELGTFYGIISDKTVRILSAMERAAEQQQIATSMERDRQRELEQRQQPEANVVKFRQNS